MSLPDSNPRKRWQITVGLLHIRHRCRPAGGRCPHVLGVALLTDSNPSFRHNADAPCHAPDLRGGYGATFWSSGVLGVVLGPSTFSDSSPRERLFELRPLT